MPAARDGTQRPRRRSPRHPAPAQPARLPLSVEVAAFSDALTARVMSLAQANRELETFSYTVSHDLRTPLTIIENYAYLLRHRHAEALGPEGTKALDGIHAAVLRMGLLIENILHMSRVARAPRREPVDLAP